MAGLPAIALETARRDGRFEREGLRVRKDGTKFWANVVLDAIRDGEGVLIGFAKITRDITERKRAEETLERTREALVQSQKMEAIGHLTGGVAHDFNNLLMAIQGSLELLKRRLPGGDNQAQQFLDNALKGAQRGAALTQRMLAFARRQELKLQTVNVTELINGMTELLQRSLGAAVQIETHFSLGLPKVSADANQLELAILNLSRNASDAMPTGGSIVISARERNVQNEPGLKPGRYVCLAVKDTGFGMDEQTLRRATEPFYTTKGVGKGTGLGLPMVLGMTEQSGGKLYLKSKPGEGTTAELCLPVAPTEEETEKKDIAPSAAPLSRVLRIVSADDDPLVAFNTLAMLEELGHTVFSASSAAEALTLIREMGDIDLLITDQAMPGMTGSELAEAVRSDWPDLPIIIATGYAELPEGPAQAIPRLAKPFLERDLADAIASINRFSDKSD
jgi:signal transduction histidine kinase/CheY-like chemotaxis protein